MPIFYLTPASIGYLTQCILALVITGYLLHLARQARRRGQAYVQTLFLTGALAMVGWLIVLLFLDVSLRSDLRFLALYLQSLAAGLCLTALLQFAYRFPPRTTRWRREARWVFMLSMLYVAWEFGFALDRFARLARDTVHYRPPNADYPLAAGFVWLIVLLLRQAARRAPEERRGWLHALWHPQRAGAQAARALALAALGALALSVVELFFSQTTLVDHTRELIFSLGLLCILFVFALAYLNDLPQTTTFMVKLVGIALVTLLAALGTFGWLTSPVDIATASQACSLAAPQTLRFTPNAYGGYAVTQRPFHFREPLGDVLPLPLENDEAQVALPFAFPLYGQSWRELYVANDGLVSFGDSPNNVDARYYYTPVPSIFALFVDLNPAGALPGGVFMRQTPERVTFTWYQLPLSYAAVAAPDAASEARFTFQLTLYPDGAFEIAHEHVPAQTQRVYNTRRTAWIVGASPGAPLSALGSAPHWLRAAAELPFSSQDGGAVVVDYYLCFRSQLHAQLQPLVWIILGSSLLILFGFPLFLRRGLISPLEALLAGIRQVDAGNLKVAMPVQHYDEIGVITEAFNRMAAELDALLTQLEARVRERTRQLEAAKLEAEAANRAKSAFIANINHELRTPLASVLVFIETLLEGNPGPLTETQRDFLQTSYDNAQLLARLIADLLDVSQSAHKTLTLNCEAVEIAGLLVALVQSMQPLAGAKGLHITLSLPAAPPLPIAADPQRLKQLIGNLLANAIKFTPAGGCVTLTLRPTPAGEMLRGQRLPGAGVYIQVQDNGAGIPPEDLPHIFERFYRGRNATEAVAPGAGLGLYLARMLAEAHQGQLWAENQGGAVFHLWLPMQQPPGEREV